MGEENNFHNNNLQNNNSNENKQEKKEFNLEDVKKFVTEAVSQKLPEDRKREGKERFLDELNKRIDETNKHIASDKQARNNLSQRIASRSKDLEMLEMYKNIIENCK